MSPCGVFLLAFLTFAGTARASELKDQKAKHTKAFKKSVCKDTRSDCEAIVGSFPSNFVCETYRGQCDRWCGFCSQVGALQRCSDVFPVSRCLFALKTLQCRRNENIGRCRKTCCDCDDYHRNCV
ncbi:uncharacterized protein [Acropora muricata]|uniref:uncharacterized protein isoform X3 n=1 Tax=Acropora muricata TaxID=159855 RepID=UPI0034E45F30